MNAGFTFLRLSFALMAGSYLRAADLTGTVRSSSGDSAEVSLTGDLVPAAGDKAAIFFTLPGGEDEVVVASAIVIAVGENSVQLKVENATGTVAKDQQVRITSASPQKRTGPPATGDDPPSVPRDEGGPAFAPAAGNGSVPVTPIQGNVNAGAKTPTEHFNKGYALLSSGNTAQAIISFTSAIQLEPRYATAYYFRSRASLDMKDYGQTVADATKAIEFNYARQDNALCTRGTGYALLGQFQKALADHSAAVALNPKHALAWNNRAHDRLHLSDAKAAIADCEQSIALDPKSPLPYFNCGYALFQLDMSREALARWNQAVQLDPSLKKELAPLMDSARAGIPDETDLTTEEAMKELIKRVVPPGAETSEGIRRR